MLTVPKGKYKKLLHVSIFKYTHLGGFGLAENRLQSCDGSGWDLFHRPQTRDEMHPER